MAGGADPSKFEQGSDFNSLKGALNDTRDFVTNGRWLGLGDGTLADVSASSKARLRALGGRLQASENGSLYKNITKEPSFYDIRSYGALPGASNQAATTAALNAIFAEINYGYFPTVNGKPAACIYVPSTDQDGWYVGDLNPYVGNPGAGIHILGDMPPGRGGARGSTLVFNGSTGGTLLDLQGINASTIENIGFNLNLKAKVGVKLRQYWNVPNLAQVGSSGVRFTNCYFFGPQNEYDSVLVQAGSDDDFPSTLQASEYRFYNCQFQGVDLGPGLTKQGWGFKAVVGGNTKNFTFDNCTFTQLYRGIEALSGYLICREVTGANIGYDRDRNAALIYTGSITCDVTGGGLENGNPGYFARFLIAASQGTPVHIDGAYVAGTAPADDYLLSSAGFVHIEGGNWQNSRATSNAIAWAPSTAVLLGQQRLHDTNKWYVCTTPGTTGLTGPTGTGTGIADGSAVWDWVATGNSNEARIQATQTDNTGFGAATIELTSFPGSTTALTSVPVYDGSNNLMAGAPGSNGTDFFKGAPHSVYCRGNRTGIIGGNINVLLPDFNGRTAINQQEQLWNDNNTAGLTVVRNDNGVYSVTVPATAIAAAGAGALRIGYIPHGYKLTETVIDVTNLFSGPAVTGIKASLGTESGAADDLILAEAIDSVGRFGVVTAERGALWSEERVLMPFGSGDTYIDLKCTVTGGSIAAINAGSLTIYIEHRRLGVV